MASNMKVILGLLFTILLFSWLLSRMNRNAFEGMDDVLGADIPKINYTNLSQSTQLPKREGMEEDPSDMMNTPAPSAKMTPEDINKKLAAINDTAPSDITGASSETFGNLFSLYK